MKLQNPAPEASRAGVASSPRVPKTITFHPDGETSKLAFLRFSTNSGEVDALKTEAQKLRAKASVGFTLPDVPAKLRAIPDAAEPWTGLRWIPGQSRCSSIGLFHRHCRSI